MKSASFKNQDYVQTSALKIWKFTLSVVENWCILLKRIFQYFLLLTKKRESIIGSIPVYYIYINLDLSYISTISIKATDVKRYATYVTRGMDRIKITYVFELRFVHKESKRKVLNFSSKFLWMIIFYMNFVSNHVYPFFSLKYNFKIHIIRFNNFIL